MSLALRLTDTSASRCLILAGFALVLSASCNYGPPRVHQPDIDADAAGALAMDEYDANGDGRVADDELQTAPGLKAMLASADTNQDGGISAEEVTERIRKWQAMKVGVTSFNYRVALDGAPVEGAVVTFEPESFLGDEIKAANGQTGALGTGAATIPKEQRPNPKSPPGMHIGLYQVKLSKLVEGREIIPQKYNEQTTLGQEVAFDVSEIVNNRVVYALSTK